MKIAAVGLNHNSAPVALREKLSFPEERLPESLAQLVGLEQVCEGVILSTCNRVEIYLAAHDVQTAVEQTRIWLAHSHDLSLDELNPHLYINLEEEAVRHGFRVASSLDSMVLGEPQILGQMKKAYQHAVAQQSVGAILNRFFQHAFQTAKRVRNETAIAENAVSVSFAAVELSRKIFGELNGHSCLLIGAGEMCELAARHLVANGIDKVFVTNRTLERAQNLAAQFDGHAFPMEKLAENLHRADIIISSTGSTVYLVDAPMVKKALKERRQRPMFFIDIAVPRDLDPEIGDVDSAFLYDMDDLNQIVEQNRQERAEAAQAAENIVSEEIPGLLKWISALEVAPTIKALRAHAEGVRDEVLEKQLRGWETLSDDDRARIEKLTRLLVNKILHNPSEQLRLAAHEPDGDQITAATRRLFKLDDG
ncbi:glutamyl-tRNA reductase [Magnetofaba australis]|uniref:Glutamyl-tRNA reductase n=1 Tax=Magnetofaba australis IT-1 TaxID=1434232 RepID=A0A1Y2JZS3_9PROT|nr:glutamyl-tRNA reductase [Magnetofaba australis]OSM00408.1 putative glutamyl-tRNA reductase [Magnetofaba australis IT-1]